MKSCIFIFIFLAIGMYCSGQTKYEERVEKYKSRWEGLIPSHQKIQYAGGMGLFSLGVGWDYGKNDQWETDIFLGFVPKYDSKRGKATFTIKQNFIPWEKRVNKYISIEPLATGLYVNTIFDSKFWMSNPEKYPNNYYTFSTKMRFWIYLGQRITFHFPEEAIRFRREITFFYEVSSCDLYLVSALGNSSLKPTDYLRLSFGLKLQIF